jgi:prevent-host-death family protein
MAAIPARELRNHTAEVLRRAEAGGEIEVFKDNRLVAKIIPFSRRRQWLPASEIGGELVRLGPDTSGLSEELRATLTETTDDLPLVIPNGVGRYVRLYRPWGLHGSMSVASRISSGCLCDSAGGVAARRAAIQRLRVFPRVAILIKAHGRSA